MSEFEVLSIVVACLALVISLVVWSGQRKLQRESNELQRVTAELSKRQISIIDRQELASTKAELTLSLKAENDDHKLVLRNLGPSDARDIYLESLGETPEDVLIIQQEVDERFPMARLQPSEEVELMANVYMGSPFIFRVRVRWIEGKNHQRQEEFAVG